KFGSYHISHITIIQRPPSTASGGSQECSKVHKKFHRDVLSKGQSPRRKQVRPLSEADLTQSANPTGPG
ncbi:unnamed protein product, partial [Rangifer tarandus platyrhynchus]